MYLLILTIDWPTYIGQFRFVFFWHNIDITEVTYTNKIKKWEKTSEKKIHLAHFAYTR